MENLVLQIESSTVVVTGVNLRNYAIRYHRAVQIYLETEEEKLPFDPIPYQLVCQSIELHLKSFIWMKEGYSRNRLKDDTVITLIKLWKDCKERNINEHIEYGRIENSAIEQIGNEYKTRQFCYLNLDMTYDI